MRLPAGARQALVWGAIAGSAAGATVAVAATFGIGDLRLSVPTAVVAAVTAAGTRLQIAATRRSGAVLEQRVARISERLPELMAIAEFSAMDVPYPLPLGGGWGLKWDASAILARELAVARPETVVELGSGGSSLVIGLVLQRTGQGHLFTLDHDPEFAARTRAHVTALGLQDWVSVLDAPLVEVDVRGRSYRWYDLPAEVRDLERVDFLMVDGPPQRIDPDGEPRYPALPVLGSRLRPGSVIFVDDASRIGEARMLEQWLAEEPRLKATILKTQGGTAILRRTASEP